MVQILRLRGRAGAQVGAARVQHGRVRGAFQHLAVAGQHQLQHLFADRAVGHFVNGLQHLQRLCGLRLAAVDLELLVPVRDADLERRLDGAQVAVGRAAQVPQAGVVVGDKGVAQDQADNSGRWLPTGSEGLQ